MRPRFSTPNAVPRRGAGRGWWRRRAVEDAAGVGRTAAGPQRGQRTGRRRKSRRARGRAATLSNSTRAARDRDRRRPHHTQNTHTHTCSAELVALVDRAWRNAVNCHVLDILEKTVSCGKSPKHRSNIALITVLNTMMPRAPSSTPCSLSFRHLVFPLTWPGAPSGGFHGACVQRGLGRGQARHRGVLFRWDWLILTDDPCGLGSSHSRSSVSMTLAS